MSNRFDDLIWQKARSHGIDPFLVKAIIAAESNFDPRAYRAEPRIGDASYGLMQVLLGTARWMGYPGPAEGLFDPEISIEYGTRFLKWLRNHFAGDVPKMVSGYNTGPGNVRRDAQGRFSNQAYVDRVFRFWHSFLAQKKTATQGTAVILQPSVPQIGPIPTSPLQVTGPPATTPAPSELEKMLSTLSSPEYRPWAIAIGGALVLAMLTSRR